MRDRIFVTGVTGYLGSAIAARLVSAGYDVHGVTRDPERVPRLAAHGIHAVVGSLGKPDTYLPALKNCDVVVHAALDPTDAANQDRLALEAFRVGMMDGRIRTLIYTSNCWVHGDTGGRAVDETSPLEPIELVRWRAAHEDVALDLGEHDAKVVVLRPGIAYGGSRGIIGEMFAEAHDSRVVHYPFGAQYWGMIHRGDVAEAYLRAIERSTGGERYLLTDGSTPTARQVAEAIASVTGAVAKPREAEEMRKLGLAGRALLTSQKLRADKARHDLGWAPKHASFVDEADRLGQEWLESRGTPVA